jgi:hypothetical protein
MDHNTVIWTHFKKHIRVQYTVITTIYSSLYFSVLLHLWNEDQKLNSYDKDHELVPVNNKLLGMDQIPE